MNQQHLEAVLFGSIACTTTMSACIRAGVFDRRPLAAIRALRCLGKSRGRFASAAYSATIVDRQSRRDLLFEPQTYESVRLERFELGYAGTVLRRDLVAAVLRGDKTATASLLTDYQPTTSEPLPVVGQQYLLAGYTDEPVGIVETTELRILPAGDVDLQFARDEGEGFETVASWRVAHERFWSHQLITDETAIVCQRFRLVRRL